MSDFERALEHVLQFEGGLVNDPDDPGGRTYKGISVRANPDAWADGVVTDDEVERIYRDRYWQAAGCDALPWPLSLAVFDFAVNSGVARAKSYVSHSTNSPLVQALALIAARVAFLTDLAERRPKSRKYLRGWKRRCAELARLCIMGDEK